MIDRAEVADAHAQADGIYVSAELVRHEELQKYLASVRAKIEAMEAERHTAESAE